MSRKSTDALVRNLKLFNAKERDHLMRFAYLGESGPYDGSSSFISPAFHAALKKHLPDMGLGSSAECVFAGMDYHLDWLFAALWIARTHPDWTGGREGFPVPVPMAAIEHADLPSVTGSQEDIDLVVAYRDGDGKLALILIEAKGSAAFDGVQLARKLIRLDRILEESGMSGGEQGIVCRLILASPSKKEDDCPEFASCREYAKALLTPRTRGRDALLAALDKSRSGIGDGFYVLSLDGFPRPLYAVKRIRMGAARAEREADTPVPYTHWTLKARRC